MELSKVKTEVTSCRSTKQNEARREGSFLGLRIANDMTK